MLVHVRINVIINIKIVSIKHHQIDFCGIKTLGYHLQPNNFKNIS